MIRELLILLASYITLGLHVFILNMSIKELDFAKDKVIISIMTLLVIGMSATNIVRTLYLILKYFN